MKRYSAERKQSVLSKLLPPHNQSVREVSKAEGISEATLYNWRSEIRQQGRSVPGKRNKTAEDWSGQAKLGAVIETAGMNAEQLSAYCRQKGLYPEQIARWQAACVAGVDGQPEQDRRSRRELADMKQVNGQLKRELRRKDKALAESAALLVLQKKYQALWEDGEQ